DIYVSYSRGGNRATNAPFTIKGDQGSTTVFIDQTHPCKKWQLAASAQSFIKGTDGRIILSNNTGTSGRIVVADAIRLVYSAANLLAVQQQGEKTLRKSEATTGSSQTK